MTRLFAALLITTAAASPGLAQTALGLSGDKTLVMIDPATATVTGTVEAQDVTRLIGIDWRPGTSELIGVTDTQAIVSIDPATGATKMLSQMDTMLTIAEGAAVIVDVNPAADKLRFMSGTTNHRVDMASGAVTVDGAIAFDAADANTGKAPMIGAVAYTNSFGKPEKTAMFDIDTGMSALIQQTKPNDGVLATIGALGATLEGPIGFDVATTAEGVNTAWLAANGGLHTVDLVSGKITASWPLQGADAPLRDLTILPAM